MKVLDIFTDREKWIKGDFAQYGAGYQCSEFDERANCFCLKGALNKCYITKETGGLTEVLAAEKKLKEAINKLFPAFELADPVVECLIVYFNDADRTTFEDVLAVLKEAQV